MNQPNENMISVHDVVGGPNCVDTVDAHRVHNLIFEKLNDSQKITVSFENVSRITTAFLNVAIGQLYNELTERDIRSNLQLANMEPHISSSIVRVVERAKAYYRNREKFDRSIAKARDSLN